MRIALVHDWLTGIGGDVRVLKALHEIYPYAPIYCLYQDKKFTDEFFPNAKIIASTKHRSKLFLPLYPSMIESIDLSDFDIVISTGSIFSKGLVLRPRTYHINYCHSPTRQVWDLAHEGNIKYQISNIKIWMQHFLRIWDRSASTRVDKYIANSEHVRARIKKYYRRDAELVFPPVGKASDGLLSKAYRSSTERDSSVPILAKIEDRFAKSPSRDYFLIVSRLFKHKNIDIAIKAFNKLGWELVIIGDGPERARLEALAGPTVHILGSLPDHLLTTHYSLATAFIMPQEEDFGIAPIEAMMHGKPVLALRAGGALEYVQEGINGLFFDDAHEAVLADGVRRIREMTFDSQTIKQSAEKFSWQKFQSSFSNIITRIAR